MTQYFNNAAFEIPSRLAALIFPKYLSLQKRCKDNFPSLLFVPKPPAAISTHILRLLYFLTFSEKGDERCGVVCPAKQCHFPFHSHYPFRLHLHSHYHYHLH